VPLQFRLDRSMVMSDDVMTLLALADQREVVGQRGVGRAGAAGEDGWG
jgi:hypothetical protein